MIVFFHIFVVQLFIQLMYASVKRKEGNYDKRKTKQGYVRIVLYRTVCQG